MTTSAQYTSNMAPPTAPTSAAPANVDLALLAGISPEQLATIARLFQSGALTLPPPPPSSEQSLQAQPVTVAASASQTQNGQAAASNALLRSNEDVQMRDAENAADKDDGEIEDGEIGDEGKDREFLRTPPTGPRKNLKSLQDRPRRSDAARRVSGPSPPSRSQKANTNKTKNSNARGVWSNVGSSSTRADMQYASEAFISSLNEAGYTFDQVLAQVGNRKLLCRIYSKLQIPVPATPRPVAGLAPSETPTVAPTAPVSSTSEPLRADSVPKRAIQSKPAVPQDRSAYLAKLQAAKKKSAPITPSTTAVAPSAVTASTATAPLLPPKPTKHQTAPNGTVNTIPASREITPAQNVPNASRNPPKLIPKNDLIRQRLEALRAQQAAKSQAAQSIDSESPLRKEVEVKTPSGTRPPASTRSGHETELNQAASQIPSATTTTAEPAVIVPPVAPIPAFQGLPGLFMSPPLMPSPSQSIPAFPPQAGTGQSTPTAEHSKQAGSHLPTSQSNSVVQPPVPGHSFRSTPNSSGLNGVVPSYHPSLRNFGRTPQAANEERMIITVSEDEEDEEEDMELDDDNSSSDHVKSENIGGVRLGNLPRQSFAPSSADSSFPGTPIVPGTPSLDLKRKLQEIEEAKRALAEAQKRKKLGKVNGMTAPVQRTPTSLSSIGSPLTNPSAMTEATAAKEPRQDLSSLPCRPAVDAIVQPDQVQDSTEIASTPAQEAIEPDDDMDDIYEPPVSYEPPISVKNESLRLHVGNLAYATTEEDLKTFFKNHPVQNITFPTHSSHDRPAGYAFVELSNPSDVERAIHDLSGKTLRDRKITVAVARAPKAAAASQQIVAAVNNGRDSEREDIELHEAWDAETDSQKSGSSEASSTHHSEEIMLDPEFSNNSGSESNQSDAGFVADTDSSSNVVISDSRVLDSEIDPVVQLQSSKNDAPNAQQTLFTPYHSPLSMFQDYRYHPDFLSTVSGGHTSLTFSHTIDPVKPLCPFEASGGACNDASCLFQHFRDMVLSDMDLLKIMGGDHMPTVDQSKWRDGLGEVIRHLRTTNMGKDASAIAARIAEYRRDFLGDPTRVLRNLDA